MATCPDVPADGGFGDIGSVLVDQALPDPARRVALLAVSVLVLGEPRSDRGCMRADRGLWPGIDGLAQRRDRRGEYLAERPPMDLGLAPGRGRFPDRA